MGKFRVTGKNDKGEPMDSAGVWTAVYVKQDGKWKVRMLTAAPIPPRKTDRKSEAPTSQEVGVAIWGNDSILCGMPINARYSFTRCSAK